MAVQDVDVRFHAKFYTSLVMNDGSGEKQVMTFKAHQAEAAAPAASKKVGFDRGHALRRVSARIGWEGRAPPVVYRLTFRIDSQIPARPSISVPFSVLPRLVSLSVVRSRKLAKIVTIRLFQNFQRLGCPTPRIRRCR